jgi:hypothetical protein
LCLPDGSQFQDGAQGQFKYPGLARSLASYCADGLVFYALHFSAPAGFIPPRFPEILADWWLALAKDSLLNAHP